MRAAETSKSLLPAAEDARPAQRSVSPEWLAEFEAASARPLVQRVRYAFIRTYKPVLDDAPFRSFNTMKDYRDWCTNHLPSWLGFGP
jgi:hypothetical protein